MRLWRRQTTAETYRVVEVHDTSVLHRGRVRTRLVWRVVFPDAAAMTPDSAVDAFGTVVREALATRKEAKTVIVFGYRPEADTNGPATFGRAAASRDGLGWDGEGHLLTVDTRDSGFVEVLLAVYDPASGVVTGETRHLVSRRRG